jgi:hypothetical protein
VGGEGPPILMLHGFSRDPSLPPPSSGPQVQAKGPPAYAAPIEFVRHFSHEAKTTFAGSNPLSPGRKYNLKPPGCLAAHSIISSARPSNVRGKLTSSALAVLRLRISVSLVAMGSPQIGPARRRSRPKHLTMCRCRWEYRSQLSAGQFGMRGAGGARRRGRLRRQGDASVVNRGVARPHAFEPAAGAQNG